MPDLKENIAGVRKWQRHHLLRQYGENGLVLPENLTLSGQIDAVLDAAETEIPPDVKAYQDSVIDLETKLETMGKELGRAYRALHGFHAAHAKGERLSDATVAYHSLTIAAAARFVNHGALDGADYFVGKSVDVLHDAMKPQ